MLTINQQRLYSTIVEMTFDELRQFGLEIVNGTDSEKRVGVLMAARLSARATTILRDDAAAQKAKAGAKG